MKILIMLVLTIPFIPVSVVAQQKNKTLSTVSRSVTALSPGNNKLPETNPVISLNSTTANAAYAEEKRSDNLQIADPTIRWYNRMYAVRQPDGNSVIGISKLSNGIAHGRIIFYPTHSAGSGSYTGSGSVGTGTSLGNIGTNESVIGVNGKNPYAGPGMYGSRVLSDMRGKDAAFPHK